MNKNYNEYEELATGQIEIMHEQIHQRLATGEEDCDLVRAHHDMLAGELVKRGLAHDTEIICDESELGGKAPNYRRGFTDDICNTCAFGQLMNYCNLYKADYVSGFVCDSFQYYEVMELEAPHGFLMAQGKQTAIARDKPLDTDKAYLIVSNGEAFGIATLEQPAQVKTKEFDADEWLDQHRITQRERRQWWPDNEAFYVYRLKAWHPYEGVKLYEDGRVIDEPRLTARQWDIVSTAKELPKQIILEDEFFSLTSNYVAICGDSSFYNREIKPIVDATFNKQINVDCAAPDDEIIPIYSLALVRNPRMRVSKKNISAEGGIIKSEDNLAVIFNAFETLADIKQEDDAMPYRIRKRGEEYCVVKVNPDDSDGESEGCHNTREEAQAQLTALNINVVAEEEDAYDKPGKRKPKKKELFGSEQSIEEQLNFIRRQFEDQFNPNSNGLNKEDYFWVNDIFESFVIVDDDGRLFRVDYMMTGDDIIFAPRNQWVEVERGYSPKGFKMLAANLSPINKPKKAGFMAKLKSAAKTMLDIITLAEIEEKEDKQDILNSNYGIAQKEVNGELWHFTWSTNAFEDRENEIFSTESLRKYVDANRKNEDKGYFNLWHINAEDGNFNTDFARKEWQEVIGRFLIEAGPYLDDEKGRSVKEFFSKYPDGHPTIAPEGWGCSPEYKYLPEERATGVYENIWITRTSTLPRMMAANIWTSTQQLARSKNMALSKDQMELAIAALKDEDFVNSLIKEAETKTAELEAANVAHKEKKSDEQPAPMQELNIEDLAAEVGKQFSANLEPIAEAMNQMAAELAAIKEWKDKQEKKQAVKDKVEKPRFVFSMQRAIDDPETIVTEDDGLKKQKPIETQADSGDPWSQVFIKK